MAAGNLDSVNTKVLLDGEPLIYESVYLDQYMGRHHTFRIAVNYRHQPKTVWAITVDDIFREKLGKPLSITMTHQESGDVNEFYGIVTDIEVVGINGDQGTVILYGGSPTILLDRDPGMGAYVDYTLHNIVKDTLDKTGIQVEIDNSPKLEQQIPYVARYKESSYAFLSRVLYSYGEWFYYDGQKLIVGNPYITDQEANKVTFDVELSEVCSRAGIRNLNTSYYDYNATENNYLDQASKSINRTSFPMKAAKQVSDSLYPTASKLPIERPIMGDQDMGRTARVMHSRDYVGSAEFTAKSKTCGVKVGRETVVYLPDTFKDTFFKDLGSFLVLEVHHKIEAPGRYENTFKGITITSETLPDDHIVTPMAFSEPAVVVDNADPRNQGRVKVRFQWQEQDESTSWIRVQTPDAGSSDVVAKNRGFVFIPEVDDQVMVGFQNGHPERPFVMGSLFHRDNSKGAAQDNNIKTISTKSGHIIEFNDDKGGDWGITIKDNNGNVIHLNTKDKNIHIEAPETMSFKAKNMEFEASENIDIKAGQNISALAETDINITANSEMVQTAGSGCSIAAGQDVTIKADGGLTAVAQSNVELSGTDIAINGSGNTEISSIDVTVAGQKQSTIQGAAFKIEVL